jgi:hypothetical protein
MQKLQRQNARLTEELRKAHIIIDVQKSGRAVGSSASRRRPGEGVLMAAVTELATVVGTRAACLALWARGGPIERGAVPLKEIARSATDGRSKLKNTQ